MKYVVHAYQQVRVKTAPIEAENELEAIKKYENDFAQLVGEKINFYDRDGDIVDIENQDQVAQSYLVDPLGEAGDVIYDESKDYDVDEYSGPHLTQTTNEDTALGFQIANAKGENIQGLEEDKSGYASFEIMREFTAMRYLKSGNMPKEHMLMPVYKGQIENFELV